MFDTDLSDMGKDVLAFIAGVGLIGIGAFIYFFMLDAIYQDIYINIAIVIIMSFLMVFFYLFDELGAIYGWAVTKDETGDLKDKLRRWSNLASGGLLMLLIILNIVAFTHAEYAFEFGIRTLIITCLTSFSVFLLLFSLFMEM